MSKIRALVVSGAATVVVAGCASLGGKDAARLATLDVVVTSEIAAGDIRMSLFKGAEAYNGGAPVDGRAASLASGQATIRFEGLAPGLYAIRAFHDLNGNAALDMNAVGVPTEPFAFSNDAPANFGPASFEAAAFEVRPGANLHAMSIR